jgi:hypothetical protein
MPEAAIDEHRDSLFGKNEIGFSEDTRLSSPTADATFLKQRNHPQFGITISTRTNTRHYLRTLGCCEYVGHNPRL